MFPDEETTERLTLQALEVARIAGERIVEVYAQRYDVTYKSDETPVTTADLDAHKIIIERLSALTPSYPVLSEESESIPFSVRNRWPVYWLVDPLDGTREFLRKNDEFSVNIALIVNGEPKLGVVDAPALGVSYYAAKGFGAWKKGAQNKAERIQVRPAPVRPGSMTVARGRCPTIGRQLQKFLDNLGAHKEISMGSALKSCLVAEGRADVYVRLGPTSEWDTAASQCIVEEAGGHITDTSLNDLRYNTRESLLNPHFVVFGDETHNWAAYLPSTTA